jgi:hypothetical protein
MARRSRARSRIAPLTSLALASSMLIALSALVPGGAAAKRSTETPSTETAAAPAPAQPASKTETSSAARSTRAAERAARRAERTAGSTTGAETGAEGTPGAGGSSRAGSGAKPARGRDAAAARRAERRAEREARKHGAGTPSSSAAPAGVSAQGARPAKATKTEREHAREERLERERAKERAREQRRQEREGKKHETRKEREAREAREAEEGAEASPAIGGGEGARAGVAAVGVSNIAGGAPTAQAPSAAAVASSRAGRAARSRHAARARRGAGSAAQRAPANAATALGLAALATESGGTPSEGTGAARQGGQHKPRATQRESPLVTTVTRIIGVVPTAVWLLIATLALAAAAFAVSSRVAAGRARRLDRQRRELLEDVGLLQAALLPELPERLGPVATTAAYRPASGPGAGGDFYDVFGLPEGLLAVIVGDVSGHGREALPHTTLLRYTLRAYLEAGLSPREALRAAAPALERQLGGSFATVVLATYDPRARLLTYSAAGHPHPILTGLDPDASIIAASAPPIGAGRPTGTRQTVVSVPGAATALFYTDGVIEARTDGELYGQRRLASALGSLGATPAAKADGAVAPTEAEALLDRVAEQTDRRPDDMAAVLLDLAGGAEAPRIAGEELVLDAEAASGKRPRRFLRAAGLGEAEIARTIEQARTAAAESGAALLKIIPGGERPRVIVEHDNIAPLRARALARTQEVAL